MDRRGGISRDTATRRILKSLALGRYDQLYVAEDGSRPIVISTPDEHISEVLSRVAAIGGKANVAIAFAKHFSVMILGGGGTSAGEITISRDLSMGMLLLRVEQNPGKRVRLRFRDVDTDIPVGQLELEYAA